MFLRAFSLRSKYLRSAAIYLGSNALNKLIPIIILLLVSHYIPLSDYGKLSLFLTFSAFYLPALSFNAFMALDKSIPLNGIDSNASHQEIARVRNLITLSHASLIIILGLLWHFKAIDTATPIIAAAYSLPFSLVFLSLQIYKNIEAPYQYSINALASNLLTLGFICGLLLYNIQTNNTSFGLAQIFFAYLAGAAISATIAWVSNPYLRVGSLALSVSSAWSTASTSISFLLHGVSAVAINFSDRLLVNHFLDSTALGKYSVAYSIGMSVSLLQDSFHKMYGPYAMRQYAACNNRSFSRSVELRNTILGGSILVVLSAVVTYAGSSVANIFLEQSYSIEPMMAVLIGLAYSMNGILRFFIPRLMYQSKMKVSATLLVVNAALGVTLNLFLIPLFGIWGAAATTFISFSITSIGMFIYWYRNY